MMKLICYREYKGRSFTGEVNIPPGAACEEKDGVVYYGPEPVCLNKSQVRKDHFCRDDDGMGMERGALILKAVKHPEKLGDYLMPAGIGYRLDLYDEELETLREVCK